MAGQIVNEKLESLRRALSRVEEKCPDSLQQLQSNLDIQDIIVLNLSRAIQLCVDIGTHIIAQSNQKAPSTMGETFTILNTMGIIDQTTTANMVGAVGFRNVAVHGYDKLDLAIVFAIARTHIEDFKQFARAVSALATLAPPGRGPG